MHLVIGRDGLIGSALVAELHRRGLPCFGTTRRNQTDAMFLDLSHPIDEDNLIPIWTGVIYLVAAMPKFQDCALEREAWRVNVDAPITLARHYASASRGAFVVFISSDAVEWSGEALARQKAHVESYMRTINAAIIRPARVTQERAPEFASFVVQKAIDQHVGVSYWPPAVPQPISVATLLHAVL